MSCPTITSCHAVDKLGNQLAYNGTNWTTPADIDARHAPSKRCPAPPPASAPPSTPPATPSPTSPHTTTTQLTWNTTNTALPLVLSDTTNDYIYGPTTPPSNKSTSPPAPPPTSPTPPANNSWVSTDKPATKPDTGATTPTATPPPAPPHPLRIRRSIPGLHHGLSTIGPGGINPKPAGSRPETRVRYDRHRLHLRRWRPRQPG